MKKEKIKVLYLLDNMDGEQEIKHDILQLKCCLAPYEKYCTFSHAFIGGDYDKTLKPKAEMSDLIVFDYGGLPLIGTDIWHGVNFYFENMIKDMRSKKWVCISNVDTFDSDTQKELEEIGVEFTELIYLDKIFKDYFKPIIKKGKSNDKR